MRSTSAVYRVIWQLEDIFRMQNPTRNNYYILHNEKCEKPRTKIFADLTRIIQSLYYSPANRCINAWMHSLKKSVKPEIVNRYDLWVLRHKIGGAKVFVNNVQCSDQMM
jgi:hypothetical protein